MLSRPVFFIDSEAVPIGVVDDPVDVPIIRVVSALRLDNNLPVLRERVTVGLGVDTIDPWIPRLLRASGFSTRVMMSVTRRYSPEHSPGESSVFGFDFSPIVPCGLGLLSGSLSIFRNTVPPVMSFDFQIGPVLIFDRTLYARLSGGVSGVDYLLTWTATDGSGNVWPRTAMVLCSLTS